MGTILPHLISQMRRQRGRSACKMRSDCRTILWCSYVNNRAQYLWNPSYQQEVC